MPSSSVGRFNGCKGPLTQAPAEVCALTIRTGAHRPQGYRISSEVQSSLLGYTSPRQRERAGRIVRGIFHFR